MITIVYYGNTVIVLKWLRDNIDHETLSETKLTGRNNAGDIVFRHSSSGIKLVDFANEHDAALFESRWA